MQKAKIKINYISNNRNPQINVYYFDDESETWEMDDILTKTDFKTREEARNYLYELKEMEEFEVIEVNVY
jgi:hypothetical protein